MASESYAYRLVRDPVHGMIGLSKEENDIINTPVFLRTTRIKQLSHTSIVYPSANHTRFEHSLGAMHVASRMCDALGISGENKRIVRTASLLHDVGHGPFSHLFEKVLQKWNPGTQDIHETISGMFIMQDPDLDRVLGNNASLVNKIIQGNDMKEDAHSLMHSIVSGNLDADKLDYLLRDSYHLGVMYGVYDLERIIHTLDKTVGSLPVTCVEYKGSPALENYRLSRYMLHSEVYEHHARLSAERMFLNAVDLAVEEEGVFDPQSFNIGHGGFLDFYATLDDASIYYMILTNKNSKMSKEILTDIRERRLLKRASQFKLSDIKNPSIRKKLSSPDPHLEEFSKEMSTRAALRLPPHMMVFHKSDIRIKLYRNDDLLYTYRGENHELSTSSPFSSSDAVTRLYVFGPPDPETRRQINKSVAAELEVDPKTIAHA